TDAPATEPPADSRPTVPPPRPLPATPPGPSLPLPPVSTPKPAAPLATPSSRVHVPPALSTATEGDPVLPVLATTEQPTRLVPPTNEERTSEASLGPLDNPIGRQEPTVSLEWIGPTMARVGQPTDYTVAVRNTCSIPVQQVMVRVRMPAGVLISGTKPKAYV